MSLNWLFIYAYMLFMSIYLFFGNMLFIKILKYMPIIIKASVAQWGLRSMNLAAPLISPVAVNKVLNLYKPVSSCVKWDNNSTYLLR